MILCMQESDASLSATLKEIREANKAKSALTDKIARLNEYLSRSHAKDDDDLVYLPGGLEDPLNPEECSLSPEEQRKLERDAEFARNFPWVENKELKDLRTSKDFVKRSDVQAAIEKLRGQLEDMNSNSSVLMTEVQRLINKRAEAVQFTSNVLQRSHETAMSVIANCK